MTESPDCPRCGGTPILALGHQSWCDTPDCDVVCWNPRLGPEQLDDAQNIDLGPVLSE